ncbi:MAG TPA: 3'-5' exonuclease, partial [Aggregatilineales bacterium]|nr:3'-5' exonuclease [Aggregatilineales bacterium]
KRSLDDIIPKLSRENIPNMIFRDDIKLFENKVKLITMHSAKGLEFPVVFLIDMSNDIIPRIESQETQKFDLDQERKLFYVSMTRASERLYIFYPKFNKSSFIHD